MKDTIVYDRKHNFRFSKQLEKEILAYCAKHKIDTVSEFYRFAVAQVLTPEIEDADFVFSSLKQVHDKLQIIIQQQEILFGFMSHLYRNLLAYFPEIENSLKAAAADSASIRFDKVFDSFKTNIKQDNASFESLLADYFEKD